MQLYVVQPSVQRRYRHELRGGRDIVLEAQGRRAQIARRVREMRRSDLNASASIARSKAMRVYLDGLRLICHI